jgi:integrase/recombinase XerC
MGKRLPVFVEEKNMEALFDRSLFSADFEGQRDALVIELFYNTGIRLSELIELKESDVDTRQGQIKVLGKRNKERIVPISPELGKIINSYIALKKDQNFGNQAQQLIVKSDGVKMYEKLVYRIVNRYLGLVTTMQKKSPHILRHTFATHMLNKGADLGAIKEILGHSSLAATQLYTHNSIEQLKDVHRKAHPKG